MDTVTPLVRRWSLPLLAIVGSVTLILVGAGPAAALCVAQTERQAFHRAEVVLEGVMLPGPTVEMGDLGAVLRSGARVRVERYLKGQGPTEIMVSTAVVGPYRPGHRSGNDETLPVPEVVGLLEDGITPTPGERWRIYGDLLDDGSIPTSECAGSHRLGEPGLFVEPGVIDLIRDERLLSALAVVLAVAVAGALIVHRRSARGERGRDESST